MRPSYWRTLYSGDSGRQLNSCALDSDLNWDGGTVPVDRDRPCGFFCRIKAIASVWDMPTLLLAATACTVALKSPAREILATWLMISESLGITLALLDHNELLMFSGFFLTHSFGYDSAQLCGVNFLFVNEDDSSSYRVIETKVGLWEAVIDKLFPHKAHIVPFSLLIGCSWPYAGTYDPNLLKRSAGERLFRLLWAICGAKRHKRSFIYLPPLNVSSVRSGGSCERRAKNWAPMNDGRGERGTGSASHPKFRNRIRWPTAVRRVRVRSLWIISAPSNSSPPLLTVYMHTTTGWPSTSFQTYRWHWF